MIAARKGTETGLQSGKLLQRFLKGLSFPRAAQALVDPAPNELHVRALRSHLNR